MTNYHGYLSLDDAGTFTGSTEGEPQQELGPFDFALALHDPPGDGEAQAGALVSSR